MLRFLILSFSLLLAACGVTAQQRTMTTSAVILSTVDHAYAEAYKMQSDRAISDAQSYESYEAAMAPYDAVASSIVEAHRLLTVLADRLESGEALVARDLAITCLAIIQETLRQVQAAGVPIPEGLAEGISVLKVLAGLL